MVRGSRRWPVVGCDFCCDSWPVSALSSPFYLTQLNQLKIVETESEQREAAVGFVQNNRQQALLLSLHYLREVFGFDSKLLSKT